MNIKIIASTKPGFTLTKEEALDFSGRSAAICYMKGSLSDIFSQSAEDTQKRIKCTLESGHHSVFGHVTYNFYLDGVPKILAILLNNEKDYNTSEKSARYTKMKASEEEKGLYEKWIEIYKKLISEKYPEMKEGDVEKKAQENARYLISVFTPSTNMEYTADFRQINYIMYWAEKFIKEAEDTDFNKKVKDVFKEFLSEMPDVRVQGLDTSMKGREFSLFVKRERNEEFGENYCINYFESFSSFAQVHRHRTLDYEISLLDIPKYYVPLIIRGTKFEKEWIKDISSLEKYYPQGMLVKVNERGTIENFIEKCKERLCGAAQLETMQQTKAIMDRYLEAVKDNEVLYNQLLPYSKGPRCTFPIPEFKCTKPCFFGPKGAFTRLI